MPYLLATSGLVSGICLLLMAGSIGQLGHISLDVASLAFVLSAGLFAMSAAAIDN